MATMVTPQVLEANAFEKERLPEGYTEPPIVAVLLPGPDYSQMMAEQTRRSFHFHLLRNFEYNMFLPFDFDADAYVEEAIQYCRAHKVQAVAAFDCFPTFLASVVNQELGLPGPSFRGVLHCCNKYYMRKNVTPDCKVYTGANPPPAYPAVIKVSDTQFYSMVRIVQNEAEWRKAWDCLTKMITGGLEARKRFYFKWATRFGVELESRWEDVVLIHTEPHIRSQFECQTEVVVTAAGKILTADTGDVVHMEGGDNITMFKTPANMEMTPSFLEWLRGIVSKLVELGYKSAAMDVEILRVDCAQEKYELSEVNSRYSYMGNWHVAWPANPCDKAKAFVTSFLTAALQANNNDDVEVFRSFDTDGDKAISPSELEEAMKRLGLHRKSTDVDILFQALDTDKSGTVQLSELQRGVREARAAVAKRPPHQAKAEDEPKEVRNLLNRTRLALGAEPETLPSRDQPGVAKIAAAVFTDKLGQISNIISQRAMDAYLEDGTIDTWCPEPNGGGDPKLAGTVTEADLIFCGWARLGYLLMTWENDLPKINHRLDTVIKDLFIAKDRGWLPVHLYQETSVAPQLKPRTSMLEQTSMLVLPPKVQARKGCRVCALM